MAVYREIKADTRPLYNTLRKMHHRTPGFMVQPPPQSQPQAGEGRGRDRGKSHDLPPRPHASGSRSRDPRSRLLSTSSAAPKPPAGSSPSASPRLQPQPSPRLHGVSSPSLHVTRRQSSARQHEPSPEPSPRDQRNIYAGPSGHGAARASSGVKAPSGDQGVYLYTPNAQISFDDGASGSVWEL